MRLKNSLVSALLSLLLLVTLLAGITPGRSLFNRVPTLLSTERLHSADDERVVPTVEVRSKIAFAQNDEIFLINPDGSRLQQLTFSSPGTYNFQPALSPDGTRIAFSSVADGKGSLNIINSDGTGLVKLTTNSGSHDSEANWSPDGSTLAFVRGFDATVGGIANRSSCGSEIYTISVDHPELGTTSITQGYGGTDPSWSPNGSQIAFVSVRTDNYEIYTYTFDGDKTDQLTFTEAHEAEPSWSPSGKEIAYSRGYLHATYDCGFAHTGLGPVPLLDGPDIFVMSNDGSNQTQITETENNFDPVWSPDGAALCFVSFSEGATQLFILDQFHKDPYPITLHPGEKSSPSWSY
jgi:Tol biopolymer transport system component